MSSAPRPRSHTGILREENLILRQVFGYDDRELPPPLADPLPRTGSPLPGSCIKDVLLVSVDVDTGGGYELISPDQSFHVGISIFDTRHLIDDEGSTDPQHRGAITSYQFINQDTKPCRRAAKHFLLGATETRTLPSIAAHISDLTRDRDYILVAHGINEDAKFLNNVDPGITAGACYVLDTVKAAQYTLRLSYRYSLEKLLGELSIPHEHVRLHAAGNDAFFALKALLMIAARDMSARPHARTRKLGDSAIEEAQGLLSTATALEAITRAPYPLPANKSQKATAQAQEKRTKLSIGAKRRLRAERKALRRSNLLFDEHRWARNRTEAMSFGSNFSK